MKRKCLYTLASILLAWNMNAASIVWNSFDFTYLSEGLVEIGCYDFGHPQMIWPDIGLTVSSNNRSVSLTANDFVVPEFMGNWIVAVYGDVVSESTTRHLGSYLLHSHIDNSYQMDGYVPVHGTDDGPLVSYGSVNVRKGDDLYLMFAVESIDILFGADPTVYYGWVQLLVGTDGSLRVGASAIDLDGGPMIVGGGSAIPEPSSVLLLLAGGALLVLRRRRAALRVVSMLTGENEIW